MGANIGPYFSDYFSTLWVLPTLTVVCGSHKWAHYLVRDTFELGFRMGFIGPEF